IQSDPVRVRQILVNLLGNAIKFTAAGSIQLKIACLTTSDSLKITFEVQDTGDGMSEEQLARLFKPFTQADESTTRRFGGSGLGLSISRRLARLLGGDVTVRSQPGAGSVFTVSIDGGPAGEAEMVNGMIEALAPLRDTSAASVDVRLNGRILLADDGRDNQRLISFLLCDAGAEVTIADNGREAVDLASRQPFDLILMDM